MKNIINNHVHSTSQLCYVTCPNILEPTELSQFGFFPKFELPSEHSIVVESQPRDGLLGLIFSSSCFHPKGLQIFTNTDTERPARWESVFRWIWRFGSRLFGTIIPHKQTDIFHLNHTINSGQDSNFRYVICVKAHIFDVRKYYLFLRSNTANGSSLRVTLEYLAREVIDQEIREACGNPSLHIKVKLQDPLLTKAGYEVDECHIDYKPN